MATYLDLVNAVLRRVNEVPLNSTNFGTASGVHALAKEAVDTAVRKINQEEFQWPFNHVTTEQVLNGTSKTQLYSFPASTKLVDWDSFRVKPDDSLEVEGYKLTLIDYDHWLNSFYHKDVNDSLGGAPLYVFRTQDENFGISPPPDKDYTIVYENWGYTDALVDHDDVCNIPDRFNHVIYDFAQYYLEMFKKDYEAAGAVSRTAMRGLSRMRTLLVNRYEYVRDGRTGSPYRL